MAAIEVKRLGAGVHAVGGVTGLCLQVNGATAKSWILRVIVGAKRREIGLGVYPKVSLANARLRASELKGEIRRGIDPVERRREMRAAMAADQMRGLTFAAAVKLFLPINAQELAAGKYRNQWCDSLEKYAIPMIGTMRVHGIQLSDIPRILEPIWAEKYVTADKLRRKLNEILDFCIIKGYRNGTNPARKNGRGRFDVSNASRYARRGDQIRDMV